MAPGLHFSMSILITGGTGSFGQAFVRRLLADDVTGRICIFSRGEHAQADMRARFNDNPRLRFFIGDVRDRDRLRRAMEGVETVVHAAALKRIEVGHYNPAEMVKTNVMGAINVIEAAQDASVGRVLALSTDKAFQPVSAYGHSKALAECLMLAANGGSGPALAVVRYGNIAGSAGSVIPKWRGLLQGGDIVQVTDPDCTRFWMTIGEAVDLVLRTLGHMGGGELVVPDLPAYRLGDLAVAMGAEMNVVGLGGWEKRHESLKAGNASDQARRMTVDELRAGLADLAA
jgi:UDP-N-acetylglucosamine 4,6-dehydratase